MAKVVKIGDEYYSEGVKVAAPKKKVAPKKPVKGGLAGRKTGGIDLDKVIESEKKRKGFFRNLAGAQ